MKYLLILFILLLLTSGFYLLLRRSIVKIIFGITVLSHAANLIIFSVTNLSKAAPPIISDNLNGIPVPYADPIPQAIILTSIVISFALTAFSLVLIKKIYFTSGTEDVDTVNSSDIIYKNE